MIAPRFLATAILVFRLTGCDEGGAAIRNDNLRIRTIAMDPTIPVHFVLGGWANGFEMCERWLHRGCYDSACPAWL